MAGLGDGVITEYEPQPHGGALIRHHAEDDEAGERTIESRQDERMAAIPAMYRTAHERLACELALKLEDPSEVFARYRYTEEEALVLLESPAFTALLERIQREVQTNGLSFRLKAAVISEDLLAHAYDMATDPLTSAAVRADLIKWTAKVGGNEPKEKDAAVGGGGGLSLNITFAGQAPVSVVTSGTPALEHQR